MFRLTGLGPAPASQAAAESISSAPNAPPHLPLAKTGTTMSTKPSIPQTPLRTDIPRRAVEIPGSQRKTEVLGPEGKKLVVGRDIRLNGAISSCDCLVVEGWVEANLSETRSIVVAKGGTFNGVATVATAEISGLFEGELTVSDTVTVRPGGVFRGTLRYVHLVSERGATIEGTVAQVHRKAEPVKGLIGETKPADTSG